MESIYRKRFSHSWRSTEVGARLRRSFRKIYLMRACVISAHFSIARNFLRDFLRFIKLRFDASQFDSLLLFPFFLTSLPRSKIYSEFRKSEFWTTTNGKYPIVNFGIFENLPLWYSSKTLWNFSQKRKERKRKIKEFFASVFLPSSLPNAPDSNGRKDTSH